MKRKLTTNDKYVHAIFSVFDENHDGVIDIDELRKGLFPPSPESKEEEEDALDEDESMEKDVFYGVYSFLEEVENDQLLERQNLELERILDEVDENKDGKISFEEFHAAMMADLERNGAENENAVPFRNIYGDIRYRIVNEFGNDPLLEDKADYVGADEEQKWMEAQRAAAAAAAPVDDGDGAADTVTVPEDDGEHEDGQTEYI